MLETTRQLVNNSKSTIIKLHTGGYNTTNEALFKLTFSGIDAAFGQITNFTGITICGSNLNSSGSVYLKFTDNTTNNITPVLPAQYRDYTFNVTQIKAKLRLKWWDGTDFTDETHSILVGSQVNLTCVLEPNILAISNYTWGVPGMHIAGYTATDAIGVVDTNVIYTNANVLFYWIEGGTSRQVQCQAELLINGATQFMTAKTFFGVQRPTAAINVQTLGTVRVDNNFYTGLLGLYLSGTNGIGMRFIGATNFSGGTWAWCQLATPLIRRVKNSTNIWYRATGSGLDKHFPYDASALDANRNALDRPGMSILDGLAEVDIQDSFEMYLMFMPPGASSIWIPIRQVNWVWGGRAVPINGLWDLVPGTGYKSNNPPDFETFAHPQWSDNTENFKNNFQPE